MLIPIARVRLLIPVLLTLLLAACAAGSMDTTQAARPDVVTASAARLVTPTCITIQRGMAAPNGTVADAPINSGSPGTNYGPNPATIVGMGRQMLVSFDISTAIPAGATITSADLTIFEASTAPVAPAATLSGYPITASWVESTATWTSFAAAYGSVLPDTGASSGTPGTTIKITGTSAGLIPLVQSWMTSNLGIMLDCGAGKCAPVTSEGTTAAQRPKLDVCYLPSVPPGCGDGIQNNLETGIDCGGGTCAPCGLAGTCVASSDCASGLYCEIGPDWAFSSYPSFDHTCRPVATNAIATTSSCTLPSPTTTATATAVTITTAGITCNVYQPTTGTNLPVVIYFPYGAFATPAITNPDAVALAQTFVTTGKVGIVCGYRGATATAKGVPEELSDVRCAIRTWGSAAGGTAFGAGYRGDPTRLGIVGSSAGGSLSALSSLTADLTAIGAGTIGADDGTCSAGSVSIAGMVKRAVVAAGPADMTSANGYGPLAHPTPTGILDNYAGATTNPARLDALTAVSPAILPPHPYPGAPMFLIIGSTFDTTVDPAQETALKAALDAHGFASTYVSGGDFILTIGGVPTHFNHPWQFNAGGVDLAANCTVRSFLAGL